MNNFELFISVALTVVAIVTGQGISQCQDVNTNACSLFAASNPAICSDPTISQTCQRFCGLCPVACYDCPTAVNSSMDCNSTILCASDEVCMTKTHSADDGSKEYILSCEKKTTCDGLSYGFHSTLIGKRSAHRRDLTFKCCDTDLCNYPSEFITTQATTTTTTIPPTTTSVAFLGGCAKDIVFVLDGSSSIGQANHTYMRLFVKQVVSLLKVGRNDSQVAVVEYSDTARVEWYLTDHTTLQDLMKATNTIPYVTGSTATHAALWLVRNSVLTPRHGDRTNAKDVVIILTDGGTDIPALAVNEAKLLHDQDVDILAVGIGDNADIQELRNLIPQTGSYFNVKTFPTLRYIATAVKNRVCK